MEVTTYANAAHLQETFAELRAQIETVLATEDSAERHDAATATAICVTRGLSDTLRIYSLTASGYERRFAIKADGEVTFYQMDGFAFRVLEAWAQEVARCSKSQAELETDCPDFHNTMEVWDMAA